MNNSKRKIDKVFSPLVDVLVVFVTLTAVFIVTILGDILGLTYHYTGSYDYSLSGSTDELFEEAMEKAKKEDERVTIYFCMSATELEAHSTGSEVYTTAKKFVERYPEFIQIKHVNIITRQDEDGNLFPLSKYETPQGVEYESEEEKPITRIYKTSVIFEYGENYRVITDTYTAAGFAPFFTLDSSYNDTAYNGEEVIASMITWVTTEESERKHAYFTQYHGEVADVALYNLLSCAGYYIDVVDLRKNEVPDNADLLIISNPTSDFEVSRDGSIRSEMDRLESYLASGGNLYVAIDPLVKKLSSLEALLADYGIEFSTSKTESGKVVRNIIKDPTNGITTDGFVLEAEYASSALANRISKRTSKYSDGSVLISQVASLKLNSEKNAAPLLKSSSSSVLEAGGKEVSSSGNYTIAAYSEMTHENGNTSHVFVIPSVYLTVSDNLVARGYNNKDFTYGLLEELFGAEDMPYGCNDVVYDTGTLEGLRMGTAKLYCAVIFLVPAALAVFGAVRIIRRKNR